MATPEEYEPEFETKVVVGISTASSTAVLDLSADDDEDPFYLITRARIKWSAKPDSPITLSDSKLFDPDSGIENNAFSLQLTSSAGSFKKLYLGRSQVGRVHHDHYPTNLRESPYLHFHTIPLGGCEVRHRLRRGDILTRQGATQSEAPRSGERYKIRAHFTDPAAGWWAWGDLESDLKDKKFQEWIHPDPELSPEKMEGEDWISGEAEEELQYEIEVEGEFEIK